MSGHIFFNDRWPGFDDAIYSGAWMLEIISIQEEGVDLFDSLPQLTSTPEINIETEDEKKFGYVEEFKSLMNFPEADVLDIDGVRVEFDYGWGLLRASNTSPVLVLRFEAINEDNLEKIKEKFRNVLGKIDPQLKKF